jgi:hypothetical protein
LLDDGFGNGEADAAGGCAGAAPFTGGNGDAAAGAREAALPDWFTGGNGDAELLD